MKVYTFYYETKNESGYKEIEIEKGQFYSDAIRKLKKTIRGITFFKNVNYNTCMENVHNIYND